VVDGGGNPNTGNNLSRTQAGPVLTQAFQAFRGTANLIEWGKTAYQGGGNGGISGMVSYGGALAATSSTSTIVSSEPGIPHVQVALYADFNADGIIDDANGDGKVTPADVDNYPFTWRNPPYLKGPEDVDRNSNGVFDPGDAIAVTTTDGWETMPPPFQPARFQPGAAGSF